MFLYIKIAILFFITGPNNSYYKKNGAPATLVLNNAVQAGTQNSLKKKEDSDHVDTCLSLASPAIQKPVSSYTTPSIVMTERNHLLYIHAKAEATQLLLTRAKEIQKKMERKLGVAGILLGISIPGSLFIILLINRRQRAKFRNFKLNLARNIHDETNPALLYAKALVRSYNKGNTKEKTILEQHIDHTMSLIRSLTHDLKSDKPHTLSDLVSHTEQLLLKLNTDNTFQFRIGKQLHSKRFISHYQFSELKAVLNECITNTIKHAVFNTIRIDFRQTNNQLTISYQDDGKGWDAAIKNNGIGIENIKERAYQLNGSLELHNQYPNGYCLYITIPLRHIRS